MLPSRNPSVSDLHSIEILAPTVLEQNFHSLNSIYPLLTFCNFASLVFVNLFFAAAVVSIGFFYKLAVSRQVANLTFISPAFFIGKLKTT